MQFDLIALDADDTLWQNEIHYRNGREVFASIMKRYGVIETDEARVNAHEITNLEIYGYGAVGFAISLAELAVELSEGRITSADLLKLIAISREILTAKVELFPGVLEIVRSLALTHRLMLITKGDHRHQSAKIERSGLKQFFDYLEVVEEKSEDTYRNIIEAVKVDHQRFMMVGNAMKSDILPVLEIGGHAVYIHNELTWAHENAEGTKLPLDRFHELSSIEELPALINRIETSNKDAV